LSGTEFVINSFLNYLSDSPLTSLQVCYLPLQLDQSLADIESTWRTHLARIPHTFAGLLHLQMDGLSGGRFVSTKDLSLLEPLLAIKSMKTLILHIPILFDFTDAGYERVALAWPKIEKLDWHNLGIMGRGQVTKPQATFAALETFATHCPNLRNLSLFLDPSYSPPIPPRLLSHGLNVLEIIHGPSDTSPAASHGDIVAKHAKNLFPRCSLREYSIGKSSWGTAVILVNR
jgi:hypothetical protein